MPIVQSQSQINLNDLLNSVAQLNGNDLEQFVSQVLILRAKRVAPHVSEPEAELLEKINQSCLSSQNQQRYNQLTNKRQAEILMPEEHQELLDLVEHIEQIDAERMQALIKLAQLRHVSISALMATLNICPPAYD